MSPKDRKKMIRKRVDTSLSRQCKILRISRSSLYYTPIGFSPATLKLMRQIDRVFTKYPFFGSRQIAAYLPRMGYHAGRHRVRRLMKVMGLEAIYKRPNTSKKHPENRIYTYLLRNMQITLPNQVWCANIRYIPVKRSFRYLVAILCPTGICGANAEKSGLGNVQGVVVAIIEHDGCQLLQGIPG